MTTVAPVSDGAVVGAVSRGRRQQRTAQRTEDVTFFCKRLATQHKPRQCPAFGKVCSYCHGKNHFAKQCFSKKKEGKRGKNVNVVDDAESDTDLSDTFFVGMVSHKRSTVMMRPCPKDREQTKRRTLRCYCVDKFQKMMILLYKEDPVPTK
uniref:Uncharacterized protein n=1 Tax=Knipowitschia caucasica TaxID=637954 RepID=A0AAV2LV26_KNICA